MREIMKKIFVLFVVITCLALFALFEMQLFYSDEITQNKFGDLVKNLKSFIGKQETRFNLRQPFADYSDRKCQFMTFGYMGRTGNQMFQYASFYGLAKGNNKIPFIKFPQFPLIKAFKLTTPIFNISLLNETSFINVPDSGAYRFNNNTFNLACNKNYLMDGYRCSWKYFENYRNEIKKEFEFVDDIDIECNAILNNMTEKNNISRSNCIIIGVHARRGDFVDPGKQQFGHVPVTKGYLYKAIEFFENRYSNVPCIAFIIAGNDYEWNLNSTPTQNNIIVLKPRTPYIDLCILSRCNHTIISSGSYGWWAAYLAGGEATYMEHQCRPNSSLCSGFNYDAFINPGWNWFPIAT